MKRHGGMVYDSAADRVWVVSPKALACMARRANRVRFVQVTREFDVRIPPIGLATNFRVEGTRLLCDLDIIDEGLDHGKYSIGFTVSVVDTDEAELTEIGSTPNPSWESAV